MKARKHNSESLQTIIDSITPVEMEQTRLKMLVAVNINVRMMMLGINKVGLAMRLNKSPSEITKWISGTQNFTLDTLTEIAFALDTNVIDLIKWHTRKTKNK